MQADAQDEGDEEEDEFWECWEIVSHKISRISNRWTLRGLYEDNNNRTKKFEAELPFHKMLDDCTDEYAGGQPVTKNLCFKYVKKLIQADLVKDAQLSGIYYGVPEPRKSQLRAAIEAVVGGGAGVHDDEEDSKGGCQECDDEYHKLYISNYASVENKFYFIEERKFHGLECFGCHKVFGATVSQRNPVYLCRKLELDQSSCGKALCKICYAKKLNGEDENDKDKKSPARRSRQTGSPAPGGKK